MTIQISAIVCTRNRADLLMQSLNSLLAQSLPFDLYEVCVVDNGSTDRTPEAVRALQKKHPGLKYLHEPRTGLSHARNTGWKSARGEIVAFLDDDAIAAGDWLEKILSTFRDHKANIGAVGGQTKPLWERRRPGWLLPQIEFFLGLQNLPMSPRPLNGTGLFLLGNNMAFSKKALADVGGFEVGLGRKNKLLLSGEESLCQERLAAKGYLFFFHPDIIVHHRVIRERISRRYFLRWAFGYGLSMAKLARILEKPGLAARFSQGFRLLTSSVRDFFIVALNFFNAPEFQKLCFAVAAFGKGIGYLMPFKETTVGGAS